eukprot:gene12929-3786_t
MDGKEILDTVRGHKRVVAQGKPMETPHDSDNIHQILN